MSSAESVKSVVSDPRLVEERRQQIIRAATKLFSEEGYYTTTILQIAREAKVSTGLIYQYFGDKDDILFLTLKNVLDTYENEIPRQLEGLTHPVDRLCRALWAYCAIVDSQRDATVLAYRSTKSLRPDRRGLVKDGETRTNQLIERSIHACTTGGFMRPLNEDLLSYQCVMFAHAWALKYWVFRDRYTLAELSMKAFACWSSRSSPRRARRRWRRSRAAPTCRCAWRVESCCAAASTFSTRFPGGCA